MTVHQIIYLCHTFIIQLHLSQIHPTKMKSKFENPHQTKQKLILHSTPLKPTPHPTKKQTIQAQNLKYFFSLPLQKQFPKYQAFTYTNPTKNNQTKNANFPYTLSKKQLLQKHKNHNDSPRPKISLILP